jgi:hypothetical protein
MTILGRRRLFVLKEAKRRKMGCVKYQIEKSHLISASGRELESPWSHFTEIA